MSDSTLIDVHDECNHLHKVEETRTVASPRRPRSTVVLERRRRGFPLRLSHRHDDHDASTGLTGEGASAVDEVRRQRFSLRSTDSIASLVSMASVAIRRGSRCCESQNTCAFDDDDDRDDDDDSTIADNDEDDEDSVASVAESESDDEDEGDDEDLASFSFGLDYKACRLVQDSWRTLQDMDVDDHRDYKHALGDALLLRMMEIDPSSRPALGISSFRSPRYAMMCRLLSEGIEAIVQALPTSSSVQPDRNRLDDDDDDHRHRRLALMRIARASMRRWDRQGVNVRLLVVDDDSALLYGMRSRCVQSPSAPWTPALEAAWESTVTRVLSALLSLPSSSSSSSSSCRSNE